MSGIRQRDEQIFEGLKDGVNVFADPEFNRFIVEMSNSYDVYWGFASKSGTQEYAERLDSPDQRIAAFAVSMDNLRTNSQIKNFNIKINDARKINAEIAQEQQDFSDTLAFDQAKDGKLVAFLYKNPSSGFTIGEVLKTGKYFVALSGGESDDKVFVRMLHTNRVLNGKDDYQNREETVEKMFPVGSVKYLSYKDGKVIQRQYQPKAKFEEVDKAKISDKEIVEEPKVDEEAAENAAKELAEKIKPKAKTKSTKKSAKISQ